MGAIVASAPLRVALGGGGTDLPSYYREHGGFVVSTAIDGHVHIVATTGFQRSYRLKHLEWEEVDDPAEAKRARAPGTVTDDMDALRRRALDANTHKIISLGAGGGFLLVYSPDPERTRAALPGVPELTFGLDARAATALNR